MITISRDSTFYIAAICAAADLSPLSKKFLWVPTDAPVMYFFTYEKKKYARNREPENVNKAPNYTLKEDQSYCYLNQNVRNLDSKVLLRLTLYCRCNYASASYYACQDNINY